MSYHQTAQRTTTKKNVETARSRKNRGVCYFLLSLLEDESYPYVQWTNKQKGEFQIHWMHASSGAWTIETDAETFRLWAKAKGKFKDRENLYKTWKANFRCAMKSRHELEEIEIPRGSPLKKKNLKFWKFVDIELVNRYIAGERFEWNRSNGKSSAKKTDRALRTRRNKKTVSKDEETESEENESMPFERCDSGYNSSQPSSSISALQSTYLNEPLSGHVTVSTKMEDDTDYKSYGAGLLQILEQDKDTDRLVPNLSLDGGDSLHLFPNYQTQSQTVSPLFQQCGQLPPFHQLPPFNKDYPLSESLLQDDWELFGDDEVEKELKRKGVFDNCFDAEIVTEGNDPFFYENVYTEL